MEDRAVNSPFDLELTRMTQLQNGDHNSLFDVGTQLENVLVLRARHKVSLSIKLAELQRNVKPESAFLGHQRTVGENTWRLGQPAERGGKAVEQLCYVLYMQTPLIRYQSIS